LGLNVAWYSGLATAVTYAALWDFLQDFQQREIAAWEDFCAAHKDNPYLRGGGRAPIPEGREKQRELEQRYFPNEMLQKYRDPSEKG
jgi:hypothetical protein